MDGQTGQVTGNQGVEQQATGQAAQGSAGTGTQSPETGTSLKESLTGSTGATAAASSAEPKAGDGAGSGSKGSTTQTEELPKWLDQTSADIKGSPEIAKALSKFKKIDELAKAYLESEKKIGSAVTIPGDGATDEEKQAYRKRMGIPETPDEYGFTQDGSEEKAFAALAHANNFSDAQAKAAAGYITNLVDKFQAARVAAAERMIDETDSALKEKYGDKYPEKIVLLNRAIETYGGAQLREVLSNSGLSGHPLIVEMLMTIGSQMSEPGATRKGGSSAAAASAIKSINDGASWYK